jgi:hypothetical protein
MTDPGQTNLFRFKLGKFRLMRYPFSACKERGEIDLGNKISPKPAFARF